MSKIEWTGETWNPIVGCSVASEGCTNCYAARMAARLKAMEIASMADHGEGRGLAHYLGTTHKAMRRGAKPQWTGRVALSEEVLLKPLRWKKPRLIFVNSMGDLFHENVPDEWIDRVFAVMALTPHHTYQVLTKRAGRMREWFSPDKMRRRARVDRVLSQMSGIKPERFGGLPKWPLPNVWLGVSVEDQAAADERIPHLRATPAAIRFISGEPLLGPVDIMDETEDGTLRGGPLLDWVIVGGESGPNARPMHPDWARSLRDQCEQAGVPFFFKQWGEWIPCITDFGGDGDGPVCHSAGQDIAAFYDRNVRGPTTEAHNHEFWRVGKKAAGRTLDGVTHDGMPVRVA